MCSIICHGSGMRPPVRVDLVDRLGDLYVWGLAGGWWALASWSLVGTVGGHPGQVYCSAWVPARNVWPCGDPDPQIQRRTYQDVPRLLPPTDQTGWPTVAGWGQMTWHHYGAITEDPGSPPGLGS